MTTTTLRGIFPDPKPVHRRNFMRENIKQIKEMQGLIQPTPKPKTSSMRIESRYKNIPSRVYSSINRRPQQQQPDKFQVTRPSSLNASKATEKIARPIFINSRTDTERNFIHRGVQTDKPSEDAELNDTSGVKSPTPEKGDYAGGDKVNSAVNTLHKSMQKLKVEEKHDYVKENIKNIKLKSKSEDEKTNEKTYQKGVVPKYLRDRQEELKGVAEGDREQNPPGLVLLPEDERKEYLRVARENYAGLIKELNSMPVRNDTLRRRRRKVEIEEELKRLDEVIKIFQKPKVFVKADA